MDRSALHALLGTLLSFTSLACLGFVTPPPEPPGKPTAELRLLDPISYENMTLFPVVSSRSEDTTPFLTLDEALSSGEVIVHEQGGEGLARTRDGRPVHVQSSGGSASVNTLVLINRGKRPLLLLAGELVSGGKQDRIIAKDRIVAPGAEPLPLDVFCVEHGRWSSGSQFNAAKIIVHPSVREKAAVDQKQADVWAAVRSGTTAAKDPSAPAARLRAEDISAGIASSAPTEAYDKIYTTRSVGISIEDFVEEFRKRFARSTSGLKGERVVGVIVAYGGEIAWSDVFASGELFQNYWPKLLRSYAVEALARPTLRKKPSAEEAREFLRPLRGHERIESDPGVYVWREISEGRIAQIELVALQPRELTLHRLKLRRTS